MEGKYVAKRKQATRKEKVHEERVLKTQLESSESQFMVEHAQNPISVFLEKIAEEKTNTRKKRLEDVQENSDYEDLIPNFLMAQPKIDEEEIQSDAGNVSDDMQKSQKPRQEWNPKFSTDPHNGFSFYTVLPAKWRDKIYEMHAWITEQMLNPGASLLAIIDKMVSKFQGRLRQWWISLGQYRQLQILQP